MDSSMAKKSPPKRRDATTAPSRDSNLPNRGTRDEDPVRRDRYGGDLRRADYRESDAERNRRDYREPEFQRDYKEFGRSEFESRAQLTSGQGQREDSPYGRPYPERSSLKEFYSKDMREGQSRPAEYHSPERLYSEADHYRQPRDREPPRQVNVNTSGRQGSSEPESNYRGFSSTAQDERPFDLKFTVQEYGHKSRDVRQKDFDCDPGPSDRADQSSSRRQAEDSRCMADVPEPFTHYMSGGSVVSSEQGKRKRKSRFSDASAEEMEAPLNT